MSKTFEEKVSTKTQERHYYAVIVDDTAYIKQASKAALEELRLIASANDGARAIDLWATDSKACFERIQSIYTDVKKVGGRTRSQHSGEIVEFDIFG